VLIALFADIHANRQAFEACLAGARADGAEHFVLLGDYVGYGADPEWVVSTVIALVDGGATAVVGNHDSALAKPSERLNADARVVIDWTRGVLSQPQRQFLAGLPLTAQSGDLLFVHAEAKNPAAWTYVDNAETAARSMKAAATPITFCGHLHRPALYSISAVGKLITFIPTAGAPVPLLPGRQWHAVIGSVGQPRDGNPAAAYAMFNTETQSLTFCRAPYDVEEAARRIRQHGLPASLANRLLLGT
jgi:diadenosine tetraphosphatase ApaH/serine/threonine PP2A family protein phosphatase